MTDKKMVRFAVPSGVVHAKDGKEYRCTHIECCVGYDIGGYNCFTGENITRGYYAFVRPVTIARCAGHTSVRFNIFAGGKRLLVACSRQSPKKKASAEATFDAEVRSYVAALFDVTGIEFAA